MYLLNHPRSARVRGVLALTMVSLPLLVSCGHDHSGSGAGATPSITSLTVTPTTIMRGQSATVAWSTTGTAACTGVGAWGGPKGATGSMSVSPAAEGKWTYSLECFASTGTVPAQQSVILTVIGSPYAVTPLVSDMAGVAAHQDPNLVNPWGIVAGPPTPFWVANAGSGTSTLYDGTGAPLPPPPTGPLVVTLGKSFAPTGIVFNGTQDFEITGGTPPAAAPSLFIFSGAGGMLAGWNQSAATGVVTFPGSTGASYKGLAIASASGNNYLYATDFANNKIDVFNGSFALQSWPATAFVDPKLPSGYAPYGIQAIANGSGGATLLYVTYAKQTGNGDAMVGAGLGLLDVYDTSGTFKERLIDVGGWLNEPWGIALAPVDFGTASGQLLVGNFGDGTINEFDPAAGTYVGTLSDGNDKPLSYPGLWGIAFGNDQQQQPHNTLFFAAGINNGSDGLYGRIDLETVAAP
jgi:uncharacterized protein (TIGR03118 family)